MRTILGTRSLAAKPPAPVIPQPRPQTWPASAACVWSLAYGVLGLFWAFGGGGFPYGESDAGAGLSILTGFRADAAGPLIAALGLLGAVVALAMVRPWGRGLPRPLLLGFGWSATAVLLLVVPDARALTFLGYLPALVVAVGFSSVDWPVVLNQGFCLAGGLLWGAATLTYQRGSVAPTAISVAGPRWGRWATYAAVLLPLPYAATRLAWAVGIPLGISDEFLATLQAEGATTAEVSLGGMALAGALLTLGLVQRWGEVFPGWLPVVGGKRVPPMLAILPATLVSVVLIIGGLSLYRGWLSSGLPVEEDGWGAGMPTLAFLPWGIALGLATYAYAERRQWDRA
ncbi:MAG: hypothetical protein ACRDJC_14565 [Thermomicrobiales bacterium]